MLVDIAYLVLISFFMVANLLISIAFMTLVERKLISAIQNRKGPNTVGLLGLLQPFADALKLILKESIFPRNSKLLVFIMAPFFSLFFALAGWAFIPFGNGVIIADTNLAIFFVFACSILHVYGVILAGWASGSKYSFLGAVRSTAQLIAYDIAIGLTVSCLVFYTQSMSIQTFVEIQKEIGWFALYLPILFVVFFVSSLAETNRHPFDLPEAESELVGGYTTEYSSALFALFFLGEYCSILIMVFMINHLFLGGWNSWFDSVPIINFLLYYGKILFIYYIFIIVRAAIPRYRYDQLMRIGWKYIIPITLSYFCIIMLSVFIDFQVSSFKDFFFMFINLFAFFFLPLQYYYAITYFGTFSFIPILKFLVNLCPLGGTFFLNYGITIKTVVFYIFYLVSTLMGCFF